MGPFSKPDCQLAPGLCCLEISVTRIPWWEIGRECECNHIFNHTDNKWKMKHLTNEVPSFTK